MGRPTNLTGVTTASLLVVFVVSTTIGALVGLALSESIAPGLLALCAGALGALPLASCSIRFCQSLGCLHHDRNPVPDAETDRLIATLNKLIREAPMADEERLVVVWTKLVELLAAIDDDARRTLCKAHHDASQ